MLKRINFPLDAKDVDKTIINNLDKIFEEYQKDKEPVLKMYRTVKKMLETVSTNFGVFAVIQPTQQISYQMIEMFIKKGLITL